MPYHVNWYIEGHVIHTRFWGEITLEEFRAYMGELFRMLDTVEAPLAHNLLDSREVTKTVGMREILKVVRRPHPKMGWNVEINSSANAVRFVTNLVTQVLHIRDRAFDTPAEALEFLKTRAETLPWDQANTAVLIDRGIETN